MTFKRKAFNRNIFKYVLGVTFEIVSQVPDIYTESEWFAQIEANLDEENETLKETFFDNYNKAVSSVETLLASERVKQAETLTEMILRQEELQEQRRGNRMRKASSVMNMRGARSSLGLNSLGSNRNLSSSQCSLDVANLRKQNRQSLENLTGRLKENKLRTDYSSRMGGLKKHQNMSGPTIVEEE